MMKFDKGFKLFENGGDDAVRLRESTLKKT